MIINVDTIGQTIRKLRQERGMTLQELTDRSGVAMSSIVDLEAGRRKSGGTVATLLRLLEALEMECVIRLADAEKTIIQVDTAKGWRYRPGWTHPDVVGLAAVEMLGGPHDAIVYSVTHIYSGRRLIPVPFSSRDGVMRCIRWLGKEADRLGFSWSVPLEEVEDNPDISETRRQAIEIFGRGEQ